MFSDKNFFRIKEINEALVKYNPSINNDKFNSVSFNRLMREIGFDSYKTGGYYKYKISIETLNKMSVDRKWIHDFDTIENNEEIELINQSGRNADEDIVDDLVYDIFNLAGCNYHPLRIQSSSDNDKEEIFSDETKRVTQLIYKRF